MEKETINLDQALKPRTSSETKIKICILAIILLFATTCIIGFNYLELSENYSDLEKINREGIESSNAKIKQLNEKIVDYTVFSVDGFISFNALMFGQAWVNNNPDAMKNFRQNQYIAFALYKDPEINKYLEEYKKCTIEYDENCMSNDALLDKSLYNNMNKRYSELLSIGSEEN